MVNLAPTNHRLYAALGDHHLNMHEPLAAIEAYQTALALQIVSDGSPTARLLHQLAVSCNYNGDLVRARHYYVLTLHRLAEAWASASPVVRSTRM